MSLLIQNRSFKGISNLSIRRIADNLVFNFPKPSGMVLNNPQEQRNIMSRSELGEQVLVGKYTTSRMPTMSVSFASVQPELFAFQGGYLMEKDTLQMAIPKIVRVPDSGIIPAATGTNVLGKGITANATAYASTSETGNITPLTQNTFEGHATWRTTLNNFAIGADGAIAFSNNLVGKIVTVVIPATITGSTISEILVGEVVIDCALVNSLNKITLLHVPSALIDPSNNALDANAEGLEMMFTMLTPPGRCTAFDLLETDFSVVC
jgi:hypothetical protein